MTGTRVVYLRILSFTVFIVSFIIIVITFLVKWSS